MTTKEKLVELFESNKGIYFSGEEIAKKLSVSRSAVWKAVKSLQNEGYGIHAVTNKGYCLSTDTDILSPQGIQKYLHSEFSHVMIDVFPSVTSTNAIVREKAYNGMAEGYVAVANAQDAGRGRMGRNFFSPSDTGLYMSLLLRPEKYSAEQAVSITTMAAVAMCETIESVSDEKAEIKWVNDIFVRGKKVCGILTEASFGLENGMLEYAVLGIGLNVYEPQSGFPDELKDIAGSVFKTSQDDMKNRLAAEFINRFSVYYAAANQSDYVEKYRERSFVVGKEVMVVSGNQSQKAYVRGIDDQCRLLVRYEDGTEACVSSGEISIRL